MTKHVAVEITDDSNIGTLEEWLMVAKNLNGISEVIDRLIKIQSGWTFSESDANSDDETAELIKGDSEFVEHLFVYAVVMYARIFATGRTVRLDIGEISAATDSNRDTHQEIVTLRNRHFAHPVSSDGEGGCVRLVLDPQAHKPIGFLTMTAHLATLPDEQLENFRALVEVVQEFVQVRIDEVGDRVAEKYLGKGSTWKASEINSSDLT